MNILIVDDHPIIRSSFKLILRQKFSYVEFVEVTTLAETLDVLKTSDPFDLAIVDLNLNGASCFPALSVISKESPATKIIVASATDDQNTIKECYANGAHGFISKSYSTDLIVHEINLVFSGVVIDDFGKNNRSNPVVQKPTIPQNFSKREKQILDLLASGATNKEIAQSLFLSVGTVKNYVSDILSKLEVSNRMQAIHKLKSTVDPF